MRYSFAGYLLDPFRRTLTRDGADIPIGERAFAVLMLLVENNGKTVTKQDLIDRVWGDVAVVEDNLVKAIGEIRHALNDSPSAARFVRTVHRHGYRFVCRVERLAGEDRGDKADTTPETAPRSLRWPPLARAVVALTVVAAVAGIGLILRRGPEAPRPDTAAPESVPPIAGWKLRAMEYVPPGFFKPSFSPVSDLLAAVTLDRDSGIHSLFLIDPGRGAPLQLTRDLEVRGPDPVFSADGRMVWFTTYRHRAVEGLVPEVMEIPVVGGEARSMFPGASTASPHPRGEGLVVARVEAEGTAIDVFWNDGREERIAASGYWPRWSPDGTLIAFTTSNPEGGYGDLWIVRPDGTERKRLTTNPTQIYGLSWFPDSTGLVFASDLHGILNLWEIGIDGRGLQPVTRGPGQFSSPSFSRDGTMLAFAHTPFDSAVFLAEAPWEKLSLITRETKLLDAAVSPDGRSIALATESSSRSPALTVLDLESGRRRLISDLRCRRVRWAPDGQSLAVTSASPDGSTRWIWSVPLDGGLPRPLTSGGENWDWPALSPDGRQLAATRETEQGRELVVIDLDSGGRDTLGRFAEIEGIRWAPDGTTLAWSGSHRPAGSASSGIWLAPANGGAPRRLVADGAWPVWEPSGRSVIFARFLEYDGLWRVPLGGGTPERVRGPFELEHYLLDGLDRAGDGGPLLLHGITGKSGLYSLEKPAG